MIPHPLPQFNTHRTRIGTSALSLAIALVLVLVAMPVARAQTFTVIHNFTGGTDGGLPRAGLTMVADGNFYGTTYSGGDTLIWGTVFKLEHSSSGWMLTRLYSFTDGSDGALPQGRVTLATDGTLYGTASAGGIGICSGWGCGTVFQLRQSSGSAGRSQSAWTETVLYSFTGGSDGYTPQGDLTFDGFGNIYGTTVNGGPANNGLIYELTPTGNGWTETVLYSALNSSDGANPYGGVVFDRSGNLYGVFQRGGLYGYGSVYQLSPSPSGWTEQTIYSFTGGTDGIYPTGGLLIDASGNLFGSTVNGGGNDSGTVFQLTPANGGWIFNTLYSFYPPYHQGPADKLTLDSTGTLYGTTVGGGTYGWGSAFKLTPSNGGWTYTPLHNFVGGLDGFFPNGNLQLDSAGNVYGTAYGSFGPTVGSPAAGTAFEIRP